MAFGKKKETNKLKKFSGYNSKVQEVEEVENDPQDNISKRRRKRMKIKTISLYPVVCGHPDVVDLYLNKRPQLNVQVDNMRIYIISSGGNDSYGNMSVSETDVLLCVYDVRKPGTVRFLRDMTLPNVGKLRKPMAIAGLGLEYRSGVEKGLVDIQTACQLGTSFDCRSTEFMCCDGNLLTFCTFALFTATLPEFYQWKAEKLTTSSDILVTSTEESLENPKKVKKEKISKKEKWKML